MIVRQFIQWLRTASAGDRADAASALARAYLHSNLSPDDLAAAEGALLMLLDDPSPLVRRALADVFAASQAAPIAVVHALAAEQIDISSQILERSPLLADADLVDQVATRSAEVQAIIAGRHNLPRAVAAAIAEVGAAQACLVLIENPTAEIASFSLDRMVERYGHLAAIREALLERSDLAAPTRQALVAKLSSTLAEFVVARAWLEDDRARRVAREACERATVALAAQVDRREVGPLIRHLCASGQLTAGLVLRAILWGNTRLFEEALAELSGQPLARVSAILNDGGGSGFRALYQRAGLPASLYLAFREAVDAMRAAGAAGAVGAVGGLKRRLIDRVLTRCADAQGGDIEPLVILLRRLATEAAREEARQFCDEIAGEAVLPAGQALAAA
jgi:uncharacterized protein (DUF2336 family)